MIRAVKRLQVSRNTMKLSLVFKLKLIQLKMKQTVFLTNDNPQVSQVTAALNKIKAVQPELDKAIAMLKNKENNNALVQAKQQLEQIVNEVDPTQGMTTDTANNYKSKNIEAEDEIQKAQQIINNGDATEQQITNETNRVNQAINALNKAKTIYVLISLN